MIEVLIVAVLVMWSTIVVFKKVFPKTSNSVFLKLSDACTAKGWHTLGKWFRPKMAAGCGGGCDCPVSEQASKKTEVQGVKWK